MIDFGTIGYTLGTALARGIVGWLKPALADQKIDEFEWKKLAETVVVVGVASLAVFVPVDYFDIAGNSELIALVAALLINEAWNAWRSRKVSVKKKKK